MPTHIPFFCEHNGHSDLWDGVSRKRWCVTKGRGETEMYRKAKVKKKVVKRGNNRR